MNFVGCAAKPLLRLSYGLNIHETNEIFASVAMQALLLTSSRVAMRLKPLELKSKCPWRAS